jgi:hypothetical protein
VTEGIVGNPAQSEWRIEMAKNNLDCDAPRYELGDDMDETQPTYFPSSNHEQFDPAQFCWDGSESSELVL